MKGRNAIVWIVAAIQFLLIPAGAVSLPRQIPRLAIISDDKLAAEVTDLLSVQLSRTENLQLLERDQMEKIRREQTLAAGNEDLLKLGQILGADGLLLIQSSHESAQAFLSTKLIAVKPGVILFNERFQYPANDLTGWAAGFASRVDKFAPKLSVLGKDALPISVVDMRSAIRSPTAKDLEKQLSLLAIEELSHEPRLFVLERRRMQLLSAEKELKGLNDSSFWNGSYLLDGTIDRDSYSEQTLTLQLRLVPPTGAAPIEIKLSCPRTNLLQIVPELKRKVLQALNVSPVAPAWSPEKESAEYFEDGKWAMKWGLLDQAEAACEASWALGRKTSETAELRIRIYLAQAVPPANDLIYIYPESNPYSPTGKQLEAAVHTLELYHQDFRALVENSVRPDTNAYVLGIDALNGVSRLLQAFYYNPLARAGQEDQLAELRQLARETCALLEDHPWPNKPLPTHAIHVYGNREIFILERPSPAELDLCTGGFWREIPEDCVAIYRKFAASNLLHTRRYFATPPIIAWHGKDQSRIPGLWSGFVQDLCNSPDAVTRAEGFYLAYAPLKHDPIRENGARQALFKAAIDAAPDLVAAGLFSGMAQDINNLVLAEDRQTIASAAKFHGDFVAAANDGSRKRVVSGRKNYLETDQLPNPPVPRTLAVGREPEKPSLTFASNNCLQVVRFWNIPDSRLDYYPNGIPNVSVVCSFFRRGKIWLEVLSDAGSAPKSTIFAVNPSDFKSDAINIPFTVPFNRYGSSGGFEICGDFLFANTRDGIKRYSFAAKTWEAQEIPSDETAGNFRLSVVNERLFVTTHDSIIELRQGGKQVLVLASSRRRPAVNLLDNLDHYDFPVIFRGPGSSLRTMLRGKIYTSNEKGDAWSETVVLPESPNTPTFTSFEEGCVFRQVTRAQEIYWWKLANSQSSLELLLAEKVKDVAAVNRFGISASDQSSAPGTPRWKHPWGPQLKNAPIVMNGESTWLLANRLILEGYDYSHSALKEQNGCHSILVQFRHDRVDPVVTPLRFAFPSEAARNCAWLSAGDASGTIRPTPQGNIEELPVGPTIFEATPDGLVVAGTHVPGFWMIPNSGAASSRAIVAEASKESEPNLSLCVAATTGDTNAMLRAFAWGAAVETHNEKGWTPLMLAARAGVLDAVNLLIEKGADVNARSSARNGSAVMMFAASGNNREVIKALVDHGADVNARSGPDSGCALYLAVVNRKNAAVRGLLSAGADPNELSHTDEYGAEYTPLMGAAAEGNLEAIELLLASGARMEERNNQHATALMEAAKRPEADAVKLLIAKGADVNTFNANGFSALIFAAYNGRNENIKLLLSAGADTNAIAQSDNGEKMNAAEWAEYVGNRETAALIRQFKKGVP